MCVAVKPLPVWPRSGHPYPSPQNSQLYLRP
jgi:hypothetical protein